jgi:hypothetical protein
MFMLDLKITHITLYSKINTVVSKMRGSELIMNLGLEIADLLILKLLKCDSSAGYYTTDGNKHVDIISRICSHGRKYYSYIRLNILEPPRDNPNATTMSWRPTSQYMFAFEREPMMGAILITRILVNRLDVGENGFLKVYNDLNKLVNDIEEV